MSTVVTVDVGGVKLVLLLRLMSRTSERAGDEVVGFETIPSRDRGLTENAYQGIVSS